jgi:hypothetical protein
MRASWRWSNNSKDCVWQSGCCIQGGLTSCPCRSTGRWWSTTIGGGWQPWPQSGWRDINAAVEGDKGHQRGIINLVLNHKEVEQCILASNIFLITTQPPVEPTMHPADSVVNTTWYLHPEGDNSHPQLTYLSHKNVRISGHLCVASVLEH